MYKQGLALNNLQYQKKKKQKKQTKKKPQPNNKIFIVFRQMHLYIHGKMQQVSSENRVT